MITITIPLGYELAPTSNSILVVDGNKKSLIMPDLTEYEMAINEAKQLLAEYED